MRDRFNFICECCGTERIQAFKKEQFEVPIGKYYPHYICNNCIEKENFALEYLLNAGIAVECNTADEAKYLFLELLNFFDIQDAAFSKKQRWNFVIIRKIYDGTLVLRTTAKSYVDKYMTGTILYRQFKEISMGK